MSAAAPGGRLDVLVCTQTFHPATKAGGPVRALSGVVDAEARRHDLAVLTSNRDLGDTGPMPGTQRSPVDVDGAQVRYEDVTTVVGLLRMVAALARTRRDVLYLNSLFSPLFSLLPLLLWRLHLVRARTVLLAPRGELAEPALGHKPRKKQVAMPVIRLLVGDRRLVWQATSDGEAEDIRRAFGRAAVLRHDDPWPVPAGTPPTPATGTISLAFVGRIAPVKNPLTAIEALRGARAPVRLTMAGVLEDEDLATRCQEAIADLPDGVEVRLLGHQSHEEVAAVLRGAHGLVLPTGGENFGYAIAEALSHARFVLVPDTTPWSGMVRAGAGRFITPEPSAGNEEVLAQVSTLAGEAAADWGHRAGELYRAGYVAQRDDRGSLFEQAWRLTSDGPDET